ncbi:MAG: hypothetical protein HUK26_02245, partial [Duodenibacillus sp.]|nr:hypothetical protein [Duodenibacillus sp.]
MNKLLIAGGAAAALAAAGAAGVYVVQNQAAGAVRAALAENGASAAEVSYSVFSRRLALKGVAWSEGARSAEAASVEVEGFELRAFERPADGELSAAFAAYDPARLPRVFSRAVARGVSYAEKAGGGEAVTVRADAVEAVNWHQRLGLAQALARKHGASGPALAEMQRYRVDSVAATGIKAAGGGAEASAASSSFRAPAAPSAKEWAAPADFELQGLRA